jgi:hypothetical protein
MTMGFRSFSQFMRVNTGKVYIKSEIIASVHIVLNP